MKLIACLILFSASALCSSLSFPVTYIWNNGIIATTAYYTSNGGNFTPSTTNSINDAGIVVGAVTNASVPQGGTWDGDLTRGLTSLPGYARGSANGINNEGIIVGESRNDGITQEPTEWIDSQPMDLGLSSGFSQGDAGGINDTNEVVGVQFTESGLEAATLWTNGNATTLSSLSDYSQAIAINDSGIIVGGVGSQPVAWINGVISALPCGAGGNVYDINDSGIAVGTCGNDAVLWNVATGKMTDLGPGIAEGINAAGAVVGRAGPNVSSTVADQAFVWTPQDGMQILPGFAWSDAFAINDDGSILGYGQLAGDNNTSAPPTNTDPVGDPPPNVTDPTPDVPEPRNLALVGLITLAIYGSLGRFRIIRNDE